MLRLQSRARRLGASLTMTRLGLLVGLSGCATTGATFGSGVGDRMIEHPPYYAGASSGVSPASVAVLPIAFQRGATQPERFEPSSRAGSPISELLAAMNMYVDSLTRGMGMVRLPAVAGTPPDVRFGCDAPPGEDCPERGDSALGRGYQAMRLAVGRPSQEWIDSAAAQLAQHHRDLALLITLEIGQYWLRQEGLRGTKVLELGTQHRVSLPWLTSLETPVSVLQVTGTLVGRDGRSVRIGAEGIVPRRTRLSISALGAQELLGEEDVRAARETRREDLPGAPLAWQEALRHLVRQLLSP